VIISLDKGGQERFPGLPSSPYVYFVHSYYPVPENRSIIAATAEYCEWISFVPPEIRIARCQLRYRLPQHWEPQNCRKFFEQRH
jgi:imidazoleglycerol phosphate synthase glutamine amidotransferase subunit HisH